jgi:DUF3039 family protein
MSDTDTLTRPNAQTSTGQHPDDVAHYYRKTRIGDAAVFGEPIPALCGYIAIPSRDHKGRAICQQCKAILDDQAALNTRGPMI